ncbi:MAG: hypothetical protein R2867_35660 [Caldilineaceae bacterium]
MLSVIAWAPATYPGYWQALEGFRPTFNVTRVSALATVAVQPDLWRGMGGATFLLSRPFILFGATPTTAVRIGFILCIILGALGCYSWLQRYLGDRAAGLAGILYCFAPPLLATIYVRGSLSDAVIIALLPLALAGLATYNQSRAISAAGVAVLTILWMWQAQAGLAAIATLLLVLYALLVERSWLVALIVVISGSAGLTTLAGLRQITAEAPVPFSDHFVYFYQLFQQEWQFGPSVAGWQDQYPFQLGTAAFLFTLLTGAILLLKWGNVGSRKGPILGQSNERPGRSLNRLWLFSFAGIVIITVAVLPFSAPVWQWSGADRLLSYPWQLLLLSLPLWAVTAGTLPITDDFFRQTPVWIALLALVVVSSFPYLTANFTQISAPASPVAIFGDRQELVILSATLTENRQPRMTELTLIWQVLQPLPFDYNIFFQALRSEETASEGGSRDRVDPNAALTIVRQLDTQPLPDEMPAASWRPGQIFTATYQLDLAGIPPDVALVYYFGYYDWRDGSRLPVNLGIDDKLIIYGQAISE